MRTHSYRSIVEAAVDVVVVEVEAMVVTMSIATKKIRRIRLAMAVAEKAIPNWLARIKAQEKKDEVKDDDDRSSRSNQSSESNSSKLSKMKKRVKKSFTTMKT